MEANFQKIIDKISEAFSFFDFSYFVSGAATYGISCYFLKQFDKLKLFESTTANVLISIVLIYLCGVISFSCGKWLRLKYFQIIRIYSKIARKCNQLIRKLRKKEKKDEGQLQPNSFAECFDNAITYANKRPGTILTCHALTIAEKKCYYTEMWAFLRNKPEAKETVAFLNRYWVMQAVCEGLIFSSILALIGGIIAWEFKENDVIFLLISVAAFFAFLILCREGRRYAETQILEVVIAYKHYYNQ